MPWALSLSEGRDVGVDVGGDVGVDVGGDVGVDVGGDVAGRAIVVLPPHNLWEPWTGQRPSGDEDRERPYRILGGRGIRYRRIDPYRWPVNPAARAHSLLRAIDPVRALRVLLFARSADVVFSVYESGALLLVLLRRLLLFRGRVVILDLGVIEGWPMRRRLQNLVVPRADLLLPYSAHHAAAIARAWPAVAGRVQPVLAHVDCDFFTAAADQPDGPVLAIGDDVSRDYATLLDVAGRFGRPVSLRTRLVQPDPTLPPNVTVLSAVLSMAGYRDLIAAAAIVVLPLHPAGNAGGVSALIQAMASGKAVVVAASPGIAEYVTHDVTALVVPCHDPAALCEAVLRLLSDTGLRCRLGAAARAWAVAHLSLEAWADRLETIVRSV